jgi:adenine deaminase
MKDKFSIKGQFLDVFEKKIYPAEVIVKAGFIKEINKLDKAPQRYIMPGLIDAHVHIESSMLTPSNFATAVAPHGTIAVVSDPHEIANVQGEKGVQFMIDDAKTVPMYFFFGAPSCVPATNFETSGAVLDADAVTKLLDNPDIYFLSEMMNYPGVINDNQEVMAKIDAAVKRNKKIDGHAPGLSGKNLKKYVEAGISTDHECFTLEEAIEKINLGMKIQIREGSAAKNFRSLAPLFKTHPEALMLCTDDIHLEDLFEEGHIDKIIKLGLDLELDIFDLIRAASVNPIEHYNLPVGMLRVGESADFIVVKDLKSFKVLQSYIKGQKVYEVNKGVTFSSRPVEDMLVDLRDIIKISEVDIKVKMPKNKNKVKVIKAEDGSLLTKTFLWEPTLKEDRIINPDIKADILKIVVINRYQKSKPAVGFIQNFGLKVGAIASSVAHDSHNIVAVGVDDASIVKAVDKLSYTGGISVVEEFYSHIFYLPVAGLMSNRDDVETLFYEIKYVLSRLEYTGTTLKSPFMTLSFMSLLVIPELKLSDKGLFDGNKFELTELFE